MISLARGQAPPSTGDDGFVEELRFGLEMVGTAVGCCGSMGISEPSQPEAA